MKLVFKLESVHITDQLKGKYVIIDISRGNSGDDILVEYKRDDVQEIHLFYNSYL
jgi:hypothetical protein